MKIDEIAWLANDLALMTRELNEYVKYAVNEQKYVEMDMVDELLEPISKIVKKIEKKVLT